MEVKVLPNTRCLVLWMPDASRKQSNTLFTYRATPVEHLPFKSTQKRLSKKKKKKKKNQKHAKNAKRQIHFQSPKISNNNAVHSNI